MIKTTVSPLKAKTIPHPKVGGKYPGQEYNNASEKGKDITFLPDQKDYKNNK